MKASRWKSYSNEYLLKLYKDETKNNLVLNSREMSSLRSEISKRKSSGNMRKDALKSKVRKNVFGIPNINDLMRM
jgi:hypothetical protein